MSGGGPGDPAGPPLRPETRLVQAGHRPDPRFPVVNPAVYRASTVLFPTLEAFERRHERADGGSAYGLHGTPTTFALAEAVAELSGGARTVVVSSGLAAVTLALTAFLRQGDHLLVTDSVYGPTRAYCTGVLARFGVEVEFYDPLLGSGLASRLRPRTRVVYLESPGSQTFEVQDVPAVAAAARAAGAVTILDNTWATPLHFPAFGHGVDVEVLAGTKHLAGHSDLLVGLITTRDEALGRTVREAVRLAGDGVAPDVCYETLRGLRTLAVRLARQADAALDLAGWLAAQPGVARVFHPPWPGDPGHALWRRDFRGGSTLVGVLLETTSGPAVAALVEGLRLFRLGASFGGYESLVAPAALAPLRTARPWADPRRYLRLHVGLEAVEDLREDLAAGLARLRAADPGAGAAR
jgi:cystathionine beta-lyase